jgi:hypothetical protein
MPEERIAQRLMVHADQWVDFSLCLSPAWFKVMKLGEHHFPRLKRLVYTSDDGEFHKAFSSAINIQELRFVRYQSEPGEFPDGPWQSPPQQGGKMSVMHLHTLVVGFSETLLQILRECLMLEKLEIKVGNLILRKPLPIVTLPKLQSLAIIASRRWDDPHEFGTLRTFLASLMTPMLTRLCLFYWEHEMAFAPYTDLMNRSRCNLQHFTLGESQPSVPYPWPAEGFLEFLDSQPDIVHLSTRADLEDIATIVSALSRVPSPILPKLEHLSLTNINYALIKETVPLMMEILDSPSCFNAEGTRLQSLDLDFPIWTLKRDEHVVVPDVIIAKISERRDAGVEIKLSVNGEYF